MNQEITVDQKGSEEKEAHSPILYAFVRGDTILLKTKQYFGQL